MYRVLCYRGRRTGKGVITVFAAGSRCSADSGYSEPIEQQNVGPLSGTWQFLISE
jgi:hypothetical protein